LPDNDSPEKPKNVARLKKYKHSCDWQSLLPHCWDDVN